MKTITYDLYEALTTYKDIAEKIYPDTPEFITENDVNEDVFYTIKYDEQPAPAK